MSDGRAKKQGQKEAEKTWEAGEGDGWRCALRADERSFFGVRSRRTGEPVDRAFLVHHQKPLHGDTILEAGGKKRMLDFTALW